MTDIQEITPNHEDITDGDDVSLLDIRHQLDHIDTMLHTLHQVFHKMADDTATTRAFITLHEPTLARALKIFDNPVARYKAAMAARKETSGD